MPMMLANLGEKIKIDGNDSRLLSKEVLHLPFTSRVFSHFNLTF